MTWIYTQLVEMKGFFQADDGNGFAKTTKTAGRTSASETNFITSGMIQTYFIIRTLRVNDEEGLFRIFLLCAQKMRLELLRTSKNQMEMRVFFRENCGKILLTMTSLVVKM